MCRCIAASNSKGLFRPASNTLSKHKYVPAAYEAFKIRDQAKHRDG